MGEKEFYEGLLEEYKNMRKECKIMRSVIFLIGEALTEQSKWHITTEEALEKIHNAMQKMNKIQSGGRYEG